MAYTSSPIYRPRLRQVQANPSNWIGLIEGALDGDEILLADGVYNLNQYAVQITGFPTTSTATPGRRARAMTPAATSGSPATLAADGSGNLMPLRWWWAAGPST